MFKCSGFMFLLVSFIFTTCPLLANSKNISVSIEKIIVNGDAVKDNEFDIWLRKHLDEERAIDLAYYWQLKTPQKFRSDKDIYIRAMSSKQEGIDWECENNGNLFENISFVDWGSTRNFSITAHVSMNAQGKKNKYGRAIASCYFFVNPKPGMKALEKMNSF